MKHSNNMTIGFSVVGHEVCHAMVSLIPKGSSKILTITSPACSLDGYIKKSLKVTPQTSSNAYDLLDTRQHCTLLTPYFHHCNRMNNVFNKVIELSDSIVAILPISYIFNSYKRLTMFKKFGMPYIISLHPTADSIKFPVGIILLDNSRPNTETTLIVKHLHK